MAHVRWEEEYRFEKWLGAKRNKRGLTWKKPSFRLSGLTKNRGSDNNLDKSGLGVPFPIGVNVQSRVSKNWNISCEENNGERSLNMRNGK
nr:hypothetical protein [Tanacetum cinerariifolium]